MDWRRWQHRVEYLGFRVIVCLVGALPMRTTVRLTELAALVMVRLLPKNLTREKVARQNIRQAFGDQFTNSEIDEIIRRMWVHLFRMVVEIISLPRKLRLDNCEGVLTFRNRDALVRALCSGRPVIILSGHFGNWEIAMAASGP